MRMFRIRAEMSEGRERERERMEENHYWKRETTVREKDEIKTIAHSVSARKQFFEK